MGIRIILGFAMGTLFLNQWGIDNKKWKRRNKNNFPPYMSPIYRATLYMVLLVFCSILFVNNVTELDSILDGNDLGIFISSMVISITISWIWYRYLGWIDIFEREKTTVALILFTLSCASTFSCWFLYDFYRDIFHFAENGEIINDFLFCVFGIGLIEETVKIVPFLIILKLTKVIDEPFDYILYGCICALGFAFVENTMYLYRSELSAINGRSLLASVMHMMVTSIITYGLAMRKFKGKKGLFYHPLMLLFLAALAHGFYDFWLINEKVEPFRFLTYGLTVVLVKIWLTMKNNLLNISPHFTYGVKLNAYVFKYRLINGLLTVAYMTYILIFLFFGQEEANFFLVHSILWYMFFLLFLSLNFSSFDVIKGYVAPFFVGNNVQQMLAPKLNFEENIAGQKVQIIQNPKASKHYHNQLFSQYLPLEGELIRRVVLNGNTSWYLMKSDRDIQIGSVDKNYFLIRTELGEEFSLEYEKFQRIEFRAIAHFPDFDNPRMNKKDTAVIHKLLSKGID